eukprot:scaffold32207_cov48-Phaeocystis_antarctica.AAC.1
MRRHLGWRGRTPHDGRCRYVINFKRKRETEQRMPGDIDNMIFVVECKCKTCASLRGRLRETIDATY